jgi:hypothetical protein
VSERRGVGTGAAAFAVLVAMLLGWWLFSGNGPGGPPGSASRMTEPGTAPVSPGGSSVPLRTVPLGLPLVSWAEEDSTLELTYRRGADDCFGELVTPRVQESEVAVTITLVREPPSGGPTRCPLTTTDTLVVDLDGPVGDRSVLDGSYVERRVRVAPGR